MDKLPRRKNIRLKGYDYSQAGYYFITICTKDRQKLFGEIVGAGDPACPRIVGADDPVRPEPFMKSNEIGKMVYDCWNKINDIYNNVMTGAFCLMPNHIHGIVVISGGGQSRPPLPKIIQGYKSVSTRMCFKYNIKTIWQRNYYDRIIRNEHEYLKACEYIENNPLKWVEDKYYI
ncbi:MAG TPA: transposase [Firmicutes bacterium]|nr:transposase [Bacillota bacterium]